MPGRALSGAFIGFGAVAENGHLPGWRTLNQAAIVAAADAMPARREAFLRAAPGARAYESAAELLARERLDFVDICTPPASHAELIARALEVPLHVLCEKPLATRLADAEGAARTASRAARVVHTVHNWLEAPILRHVSALLSEDAIGSLRRVRWSTLRRGPAAASGAGANWRTDPTLAGGGILLDHGWHALYCVTRWLGRPPSAVAASLETRRYREWALEDTATLALDFGSAAADIHLSWAADERASRIELEGERGRIEVAGERIILEGPSGKRSWSHPPPLSEGSHHPDWFAGVAAEFRAAVLAGKSGNLEEALLCARLIDLAQRSSAAGGARLELEP